METQQSKAQPDHVSHVSTLGNNNAIHKTRDILFDKQQLGHRYIESTMSYTQLVSFESNEYHTARATLEDEDKLIKAGFEFVRYSEKDDVAAYRKRK